MGKKGKSFIDKSKSLTFQVVHRSQRDPAMADMDASKLVLKPVAPSYNLLRKGKALQPGEVDYDFEEMESEDEDLDAYLENMDDEDDEEDDDDEDEDDDDDYEDYDEDEEPEIQEQVDFGQERKDAEEQARAAALASLRNAPSLADASKLGKTAASASASSSKADPAKDVSVFGIFFKDQKDYDYTQHLKPIGEDPNAVFIDSKAAQERAKAEAKHKGGIRFMDDSASTAMSEVPRRKVGFNIPNEVLGSEYEDRVGMLARGEKVNVIDVEPSMRETIYALEDEAYVEEDIDDFFDALNADDVPEELKDKLDPEDYFPDQEDDDEYSDDGEGDWYDEYQKYKNQGDSDDEYEEDDELGSLMERKTALTNLSMTSSAMVRTKLLTNLDDQFDEALKAYDDDQIGDLEGDAYDPDTMEPTQLDSHVAKISEARMNKIFDSFLESTEVVGRKGLVLPKVPESVKIDAIRDDLRDVTRVTEAMKLSVDETIESGEALDEAMEEEIFRMYPKRPENKWDVETVLSTYSNIYNHPHMIKDIMTSTRKIKLSKRGPVLVDPNPAPSVVSEEGDEDDDEEDEVVNKGKARTKGESKEEKKARKQAVKEAKKDRRSEKKTTKELFKKETSHQQKAALNKAGQAMFVPV
ncbi:hypothetical protein BCR33DRAFT_717949 [Rhizoclosmatium globosum]|uniref:Low temperature viability protein n=1 Tax=Rhizoclosmatium globosum TaxID=329046 RepID=A0A1Y2C737_9FUNG|nr:hypothetical protein BCR33DRAFT_717949 [Rhizoclosmatium globosum]|eukprot:ORY42756.1 hypothetical protein BCR33DRAFT_717949 [Rhizoclosmatium globosum]